MKVLYDGQAFEYGRYGGVPKCFCQLISHLPKEVEYHIALKKSDNQYIRDYHLVENVEYDDVNIHTFLGGKPIPGRRTFFNLYKRLPFVQSAYNLNRKIAIEAIKERKFDVFHPTLFDPYFLPYLKDVPFVLTIHDMTHEIFRGQAWNDNEEKYKRLLADKAAAIVAISQNTKKDILRFYDVPEEKIHVIYHGYSSDVSPNKEKLIKDPYFLFVGGRSGYKNFVWFLKQFKELNRSDVKMVCAGTPFNSAENALINELGLTNQIISITPTDSELLALYRDSIAFVYPSLYEGFGLPILEAFSQGCPLLLSDSSCFPEIAGDAAIYFSEKNEESDCVEKLRYLVDMDTATRNKMISCGKERLRLFSWEKSAEQLLRVYNSVV